MLSEQVGKKLITKCGACHTIIWIKKRERNMKKLILHTTILFMLLMSGGKTPSVNELKLYKEIERLKLMDVTTRFIDNETVELKQDWSGFRRIKTLREPDIGTIQSWINQDSMRCTLFF